VTAQAPEELVNEHPRIDFGRLRLYAVAVGEPEDTGWLPEDNRYPHRARPRQATGEYITALRRGYIAHYRLRADGALELEGYTYPVGEPIDRPGQDHDDLPEVLVGDFWLVMSVKFISPTTWVPFRGGRLVEDRNAWVRFGAPWDWSPRRKGWEPPSAALSTTLRYRLALVESLCRSLARAHAMGRVHGDLGRGWISESPDGWLEIKFPTEPPSLLGASPEQLRGDKANERSDVFVAASLAYEILTGRKPFGGEPLLAMMYRISNEEPLDPRQHDSSLPLPLVGWLRQGLEKNPVQRFPDGGAMLEAFDHLVRSRVVRQDVSSRDPGESDVTSSTRLDARHLAYLRESDALDGAAPVDYSRLTRAELAQSHAGALLDALELGRAHTTVSFVHVLEWQAKVVGGKGQLRVGANVLEPLLADIRRTLPDVFEDHGQIVSCVFAADVLQRFLSVWPFTAANGRTGRLLLSYLLAYMGQILMVFRGADRESFEAGRTDPHAMRRLILEKTRETIIGSDGEVWERTQSYESADSYSSPDGKQRFLVECHDLVNFLRAEAASGPPRVLAPVTDPAPRQATRPQRWITWEHKGEPQRRPLEAGEWVVGRGSDCDIVIADFGLSRRHAKIVVDEQGAHLADLRSKGGTKVNGVPVLETRLSNGDEVILGTFRLCYLEGESERVRADAPVWFLTGVPRAKVGMASKPTSESTLLGIQRHFHVLIRSQVGELLAPHGLPLPELRPLLESGREAWFLVPGMYGGFRHWFEGEGEECKLLVELSSRVWGSRGRYEVTANGSKLLVKGERQLWTKDTPMTQGVRSPSAVPPPSKPRPHRPDFSAIPPQAWQAVRGVADLVANSGKGSHAALLHQPPEPIASTSVHWIDAPDFHERRRLARRFAAERQGAGASVMIGYADETGVTVEVWMPGMPAPMGFIQRMRGSDCVGAPIAVGICSWENPD